MQLLKITAMAGLAWLIVAQNGETARAQVYGTAVSRGLRSPSVYSPRGSNALGSFRAFSTSITSNRFTHPSRNSMYRSGRTAPSFTQHGLAAGQSMASASLLRAGSRVSSQRGGMAMVDNRFSPNAISSLLGGQTTTMVLGRPDMSARGGAYSPMMAATLPMSSYGYSGAGRQPWLTDGVAGWTGSRSLAQSRSLVDQKAMGTEPGASASGNILARRTLSDQQSMGVIGGSTRGYGQLLMSRSGRFLPR